MKVHELILQLKEMPQNDTVMISLDDGDNVVGISFRALTPIKIGFVLLNPAIPLAIEEETE